MAHPAYIREKAIQLRLERKFTIDQIAECLALSRTTVFYWVRGIEIPRAPGSGFPTSGQKKGTRAMQAKYQQIREEAYRQGKEEFDSLVAVPGFRDFVCMYIGEGYKRSRNDVGLGNSDPTVVSLANRWISQLGSNKIRYSLQYHADQDLPILRRFWANLLGTEPEQINLQRKSNSNQLTGRTWRSKYGVLTVSMGDTCLRARLQAWMDRLRAEWG